MTSRPAGVACRVDRWHVRHAHREGAPYGLCYDALRSLAAIRLDPPLRPPVMSKRRRNEAPGWRRLSLQTAVGPDMVAAKCMYNLVPREQQPGGTSLLRGTTTRGSLTWANTEGRPGARPGSAVLKGMARPRACSDHCLADFFRMCWESIVSRSATRR